MHESREHARGVYARAVLLLVLPLVLGFKGCEGPAVGDGGPPKYKYVDRKFDNKLYRTFTPLGQKGFKRIQTFEVTKEGQIDIRGNRELGNNIENNGIIVGTGVSSSLPPSASVSLTPKLYVLDVQQDRVLEFDADREGPPVAVALEQLGGVALKLSPDQGRVYVLLRRQNAVGTIPARPAALVVMQTRPLRMEKRIDLTSLQPQLSEKGLEIAADGRELYFVDEEGTPRGAIVRMDGMTGAVINRILPPRSTSGFGTLLLSPDNKVLYARAGSFVYGIDTRSQSVSFEVLTGGGVSLAVHPDGQTLFASRSSPLGVQVVDAVQGTLGALVGFPAARSVTQMQMAGDGSVLFFNDDEGGGIYSLRLRDNAGFRVETGTGRSFMSLIE